MSVPKNKVNDFILAADNLLKDVSTESVYLVDEIYNKEKMITPLNILSITDLNGIWGKDVEEPLIAIEKLRITKDMIILLSPDKSPTIKITLSNKVDIMKFKSSK